MNSVWVKIWRLIGSPNDFWIRLKSDFDQFGKHSNCRFDIHRYHLSSTLKFFWVKPSMIRFKNSQPRITSSIWFLANLFLNIGNLQGVLFYLIHSIISFLSRRIYIGFVMVWISLQPVFLIPSLRIHFNWQDCHLSLELGNLCSSNVGQSCSCWAILWAGQSDKCLYEASTT